MKSPRALLSLERKIKTKLWTHFDNPYRAAARFADSHRGEIVPIR